MSQQPSTKPGPQHAVGSPSAGHRMAEEGGVGPALAPAADRLQSVLVARLADFDACCARLEAHLRRGGARVLRVAQRRCAWLVHSYDPALKKRRTCASWPLTGTAMYRAVKRVLERQTARVLYRGNCACSRPPAPARGPGTYSTCCGKRPCPAWSAGALRPAKSAQASSARCAGWSLGPLKPLKITNKATSKQPHETPQSTDKAKAP